MKRFLSTCVLVLCWAIPSDCAHAQSGAAEYLRTNPRFLRNFRDVIESAGQSVVRVQCDGKDTCLGVIIGADGWILTKAHDLNGKITCILKDGQPFDAEQVGVHPEHDLAMLKIKVRQLKPIVWHASKNALAGSWVASVGLTVDPAAVGVVSVPTRKVHEAYLGAKLEVTPQGLTVLNVMEQSAAFKAGIRSGDIILRMDGQRYTDLESFTEYLAGHKPGNTMVLTIRRDNRDRDVKAILQSRERGNDFRAEFQNRLGSELSSRRNGYAIILQHDSVLKPGDCGSPLVDLQGHVIGLNISRAGRVETWAIPAEVIEPILADLKSGRLAPKTK